MHKAIHELLSVQRNLYLAKEIVKCIIEKSLHFYAGDAWCAPDNFLSLCSIHVLLASWALCQDSRGFETVQTFLHLLLPPS